MMDHIRQRDWCSTRRLHDHFIDERDIDNCVVERIIRNKFWDPMISSDEEGPPGPIDWDSIFKTKSSKENKFRRFVPGFRKLPPHPKLSALTEDEHKRFIRILSAANEHILPDEFVGKPSKTDLRIFEEKKELYAKEQQEYIEWAKHLWTTTNCIRALRPKPQVEVVYEAEFKLKSLMIQSFPKSYALAAQIPLKDENHECEIILPNTDLIKVDISKLPKVRYPDIYEAKQSIICKCPLPKPCALHSCRFQLPNETEPSLLPLTEIHRELAQLAAEQGCGLVLSEGGAHCLLEPDRAWSLPLSVCELISPDGDKTNVVVLGSEFPERKEPAPVRSYRAFRHLLHHAFTAPSKARTYTEQSDSSTHMSLRSRTRSTEGAAPRPGRGSAEARRAAVAFNAAVRRLAQQDSDSDEDKLEIVVDDNNKDTAELNDDNEIDIDMTNNINTDDLNTDVYEQPRKILKPRIKNQFRTSNERMSTDRNQIETSNKPMSTDNNQIETSNDRMVPYTNNQIETSRGRMYLDKNQIETPNDKMDTEESDTRGNQKPFAGFYTQIQTDENVEVRTNSSNHIDRQSSQVNKAVSGLDTTDSEGGYLQNEDNNQTNIQEDQFDIKLHKCVCEESECGPPPPRSYKKLQLKNHTTRETLDVIVHCSHKLRNNMSTEVLLEPILEYQLDLGGAQLSPHRRRSLALALLLRPDADLVTVRVDGSSGELVCMRCLSLRTWSERESELAAVSNTLYTALSQLQPLLPGHYLLSHEPSHGNNALLFARSLAGPRSLQAAALCPAEEARLVHPAPLDCVLLPLHKFRRQLPLAFTYCKEQVAKENKTAAKKKTPPAALQLRGDDERGGDRQWPKKRGKKKGKKTRTH